MKQQVLFFFFLIFGLCSPLSGQDISGIVTDKQTGKPVDGANVAILSDEGRVLSYAISDAKGKFSVPTNDLPPTSQIHISFLGYKTQTFTLSAFPSNGKIELVTEAFQLKDIKVSARRIKEKHDTLVYSVKGFSMPQDRSIADVIAQMPGMEIKDNGQIAYNGKNINKFYIEGMDLMGNRYALASNNIDKQRVKSVEVIRNHQPVELLRGKSFSEQAAINLVLEDNSKLNIVGSADIGGGTDKDKFLYQNRLMGMLFRKKQQNLSIYKNDNTGKNLFREINPINLKDFTEEAVMEESMVSPVSILSPDLDPSRFNFNRSHLVATNHLSQVAEKTSIRTQISFFNDVSEQSNYIETRYVFDGANPEILQEDNALSNRRNRLDANLNVEINRQDLYLANELKTTFDWLSAENQNRLNHVSKRLDSDLDRKFFSNELNLKLPLSNNRYISLTSVNAFNDHPQTLSLFSGGRQQVDYTSFFSHTSTSFRHKLFNMYVNYTLGMKVEAQSIASRIDNPENASEPEAYAWMTDMAKQRFVNCQPYAGIGIHYQKQDFRAEGEIALHSINWRLKATNPTAQWKAQLCPEANLSLGYDLNAHSSVSLRYGYAQRFPNLRDLYQGNLFVSYRSITDKTHTPQPEASHHATLHYQYTQPLKGFFLSVMSLLNITQKHSAYYTTTTPDNQIVRRSLIDADYQLSTVGINGRISQAFSFWKSLLAVNGSCMLTKNAQYGNEGLQTYNAHIYSAALSFSARPLRFLSIELSTLWQRSKIALDTDIQTDRLTHQADITLPLFTNFTFSIKNSICQSLDIDKHTWFADLSAMYTFKRFDFEIIVNNLIGQSRYEQEFISSIEQNYYRYTLRLREIIGKISFNF